MIFEGIFGHPNSASRNGVPLEIVSKVILRHQDLETTQAYLGRVTEWRPSVGWMYCMEDRKCNLTNYR